MSDVIIITLEIIQGNGKYSPIMISIADSGPGILEDLKEEVFKPFKKFGDEAGIGLGLAITIEAVEFLSGKIWIGAILTSVVLQKTFSVCEKIIGKKFILLPQLR